MIRDSIPPVRITGVEVKTLERNMGFQKPIIPDCKNLILAVCFELLSFPVFVRHCFANKMF